MEDCPLDLRDGHDLVVDQNVEGQVVLCELDRISHRDTVLNVVDINLDRGCPWMRDRFGAFDGERRLKPIQGGDFDNLITDQ